MAAGVWSPERRALTVGLVATVTLVAFESLAVSTIAPDIEEDLGDLALYGWVFSGFFLGGLVGTVLGGRVVDRRGPVPAYVGGLALFAGGLVLGGLAPTMLTLVVARVVQGLGAGAVPAVAYVTVGRAYPEELRPRMFAVTSTAWVVPGLVGPAMAGAIASATTWRAVFLGLTPLVLVAGTVTVRALRGSVADDPPPAAPAGAAVGGAIQVAVGVGLLTAGLAASPWWKAAALVAGGAAVGAPAFVRLVPAGTVRAAPGLPAAVLARGLLTFAFFGADAYVPLALTETRGTSTTVAGLAVTAATLSWTAGSWVQERRVLALGARRMVRTGFAVLLAGLGGAALFLWDGVPLPLAVVVWAAAGLGIGLAYAPISVTVLREAPPGRTGEATAAMQLSDVVGISLGTGAGGAAIAVGDAAGWVPAVGVGLAFGLAAAVGVVGLLVARRLPGPVPR
ncbi:MAG TPA: MFS transporter [Acidimicrobiales bacterium]|jgi:MFS family permease